MMHARSSTAIAGRIILLVALVLATGLGSAARASCAMHGLGSVAQEHAGMAHHAGHHQQGHSGNHSDGCCCAGECTGAAHLATVAPPPTVRVAVLRAEPTHAFDLRVDQRPVAEPERLLPFANGPPVAASV